jgi:multiple sugar transport system permease protein
MKSLKTILLRIRESDRNGYGFILPYIIFFCMFIAYPLVFSFVLVFHRWNIVTPMEWIGFKNFARLFNDPLFGKAIVNTLVFLALHIPLQVVIALFFAILLNSAIKFRGLFRSVYFFPVIVSGVVVTILWQQLYNYDNGLFNNVLAVFGLSGIPWLVDPAFAMPSIAIMATWKNVGLYIVLFLVGLQTIPAYLYEAAEIDGASRKHQFLRITLPMLNPTIVVIFILSTIGGFSLFIEPYIMTGGGPMNSTLSAMLYIYNQAFSFNHMGYAAALGFVFALIILFVVTVQRRIMETEDYST